MWFVEEEAKKSWLPKESLELAKEGGAEEEE
jgi:hypothetical protein